LPHTTTTETSSPPPRRELTRAGKAGPASRQPPGLLTTLAPGGALNAPRSNDPPPARSGRQGRPPGTHTCEHFGCPRPISFATSRLAPQGEGGAVPAAIRSGRRPSVYGEP